MHNVAEAKKTTQDSALAPPVLIVAAVDAVPQVPAVDAVPQVPAVDVPVHTGGVGNDSKNTTKYTGKCKRKKMSALDCEQVFADVRGHFVEPSSLHPPLFHTAHSMFEMLCNMMEKEFPNSLSQELKTQMLQSLLHDACETSVRASAAT